jgi:hypothetical protein
MLFRGHGANIARASVKSVACPGSVFSLIGN